MTKDDQIVEGDRVSVYWENVQNIFDVLVLHAPSGPGEVWILKENDLIYQDEKGKKHIGKRGTVHYVVSFSRMTKEFPNTNPYTKRPPRG